MKYAPFIPKRTNAVVIACLITLGVSGLFGLAAHGAEIIFSSTSTNHYVNKEFGLSFIYPRYIQISHYDDYISQPVVPTLRAGDYYWNEDEDNWKNHDNLTHKSKVILGLEVELENWGDTAYFTEFDYPVNEYALFDRRDKILRYSKEYEVNAIVDAANEYIGDEFWEGDNLEQSEIELWGRQAQLIQYDMNLGSSTRITKEVILLYDDEFTLKIQLQYRKDIGDARAQIDTFLNSLTWDKL